MPPSHVLPGRRAAGCAGKWGRQVRGRCTALHCARGRTCVQGRPRAPHHARATRQHLGGLAQPHPCVDQRPHGLGVARDERLAQRRARRRGALHLGAGEPAHSSGERLRHHQETQRPPHDAHEPSQLRARRRHRHRRPATSARGGKRRECKENCFFTLPQSRRTHTHTHQELDVQQLRALGVAFAVTATRHRRRRSAQTPFAETATATACALT